MYGPNWGTTQVAARGCVFGPAAPLNNTQQHFFAFRCVDIGPLDRASASPFTASMPEEAVISSQWQTRSSNGILSSVALPLFSSSLFTVTSTYYVRLFPKRYFGRLPWPILWIVVTCLDVCSCSILDYCFTDLLLILLFMQQPL